MSMEAIQKACAVWAWTFVLYPYVGWLGRHFGPHVTELILRVEISTEWP